MTERADGEIVPTNSQETAGRARRSSVTDGGPS